MPPTLRPLNILPVAIGLAALAVGARAADGRANAPRTAWQPVEYPITFWCGPPEGFHTPERFREIREAGFTIVSPPCSPGGPHGDAATVARNRAMLDLAQGAGLKVFVADNRMPHRLDDRPGALARVQAIVDEYSSHPALAGYSVKDEPQTGEFPGLAEVVAALKERDPAHPSWINLLPFTGARPAWGAPSYEQYMRSFVEMVKPFTLSYDHYTFTNGGDAPTFVKNLSVARNVSREKGIPFWNIVLLTQHGPYRNLTEPELRYEAMQTLAYGAKGLVWFTYWTPVDASFEWTHAMINADGSRDPHYDMVKRINWEVRAYGSALLNADAVAVFHTGTRPMGGDEWTPGLSIRVLGNPDLTVGVFIGESGESYALVANPSYREPATVEVAIGPPSGSGRWTLARFKEPIIARVGKVPPDVERMSPLSRRWFPVKDARQEKDETVVKLSLAPAEAALLRW